MREHISPEEKLLRLIRGNRRQNVPAAANTAFTPETAGLTASAPKALRLPQGFLTRINPRQIVRWGFVLSGLYLIISLAYPWFGINKAKPKQLRPAAANGAVTTGASAQNAAKPIEFYLEGVRGKQIFGQAAQTQERAPQIAAGIDIAENINLVGIISGANPQAIIEDKKNQKTYYVSKGQLVGEFQVDDIGEGKIVVSRGAQKFELYL